MVDSKSKAGGKTKRQIAQEEKRSFWQEHIQGWKESGIKQTEYCREHGLSRDQFTYWKGKLTQDRLAISDRAGICLVPIGVKVNVQPVAQSLAAKPLVVVVDGHYRIEVSGDFETATLGKLVSTLRQL